MAALIALKPGTILSGDFRIVRLLAEGGMGAVYVAEQLSTGKQRALKVLTPALVADPRARERFAQEARIGGQIASDHVVEVVAAGIDPAGDIPWLAMELLEGEDLAARVARVGRLPLREALEVLAQLCDALGRAHAAGVVHRDLKPENIFIATSRRRGVPFTVKVLDFGISRLLLENKTAATVTSTIGSPFWMAPEQAQRGAKVRPATDVWAIGLIAFYTLTGRFYWHNANASHDEFNLPSLLVEVLTAPIEAASQRARAFGAPDALPPGFDAWFERCVDRASNARFRNADEAFEELRRALTTTVTTIPPTQALGGATVQSLPPLRIDDVHGDPHASDDDATPPVSTPFSRGARWIAVTAGVVVGLGGVAIGVSSMGDATSAVPTTQAQPSTTQMAVTPSVAPVIAAPPAPPTPVEPATVDASERDRARVVLADDVEETWRLVWTSPTTRHCFDREVVLDVAAWDCNGLRFADQGDAVIVRESGGVEIERFDLGPLFRMGDGSLPERPTFARWTITDDDLERFRATPEGTDLLPLVSSRPLARVLALADYNGDGIAAEFAMQVSTSHSGEGRPAVLIGLGRNGHLRLFGRRDPRGLPFMLTSPEQWEQVRGGQSARLVQEQCGDHGSETERVIFISWRDGELTSTERELPCPPR